jgi:hypothetical protein
VIAVLVGAALRSMQHASATGAHAPATLPDEDGTSVIWDRFQLLASFTILTIRRAFSATSAGFFQV